MGMVQTLLARTGLAGMLGLQMGGARDMYMTFGWNKKPVHLDFVRKYRSQDIARRVIDAPVKALWADPPQLEGDDTFNKSWQDLLASTQVFNNLQKVDKLAGLGVFALMVVGFDDGADLSKPVKFADGRKILYLQPYAEGSITISQFEANKNSPRFGLPVMYRIDQGNFNKEATTKAITSISLVERSFDVHWTRVLHVAEGALESPVFGASRLECVYNVLDDILKVAGGSAETFWLNANRGLHVDVDKEMELDGESEKALSDELDEYSNQLRRVIRTRGVRVSSLGADPLDPRGVFDVQMSLLASATGIPKRVLAGSEAGQLASQQDRANWAQRVEERIAEHGNPVILLPFIRMLIDAGVLPKPKQLTITWPDAFKMNPLERAQTSAQMARSAANLAKTLATVRQINHDNAVDSMPTETPIGGGGFFGNAEPPKDKTSSEPSQPQTITTPALFDKKPKDLVLLTEEECRSIIGFGKHMPVFDDSADTTQPVGSGESSPTAALGE